MNANQLAILPTPFLKSLLVDIKAELQSRRPTERIASRREFIFNMTNRNDLTFDEYRQQMNDFNSKECRSLPNINEPVHTREKYFESLIRQDWSEVFPSDCDSGSFYVYAHVDPTMRIFNQSPHVGGCYKGSPFYIGKGSRNRAWDMKRNQGHGTRLRHLASLGWAPDDLVHVAFEGLSETKALEIESKLIYFFGTTYQVERKFGTLLNLDTPKTPVFVKEMEKIVIRKQFEAANPE